MLYIFLIKKYISMAEGNIIKIKNKYCLYTLFNYNLQLQNNLESQVVTSDIKG